MQEMKYTLKVSYKQQKEIFRIIEVSGGTKLDHLHKIITNAFDFDDEHLYMFSLKRKKYDSDGYYAPGSGAGGHSAARTRLNELGLKPRNKILFCMILVMNGNLMCLFQRLLRLIKKSAAR